MEIYYIDRESGKKKKEVVAGDRFLKWIYHHPMGRTALEIFIKHRIFSKLYGKLQDIPFSARKIEGFVKELAIDMKEAERENIKDYFCFNDFFARKMKRTARHIDSNEGSIISPADGRVFAYQKIDKNQMLQVKGFTYNLYSMLNNEGLAEEYDGGTCIVVRLCPSDYHRFHFPDSGVPSEHVHIKGHYYSVNPIALHKVAEIYCQNKREITVFNSLNFSKILLLEVGATCVGSIIQTFKPGEAVNKGDEKGYFKFGGSTVIMLLKEGQVSIHQDILDNTEAGIETKINMGEAIGCKQT